MEWSATQDKAANKSTVTAKLYWIARDSYGGFSSSPLKTSGIQFDGGAWSTEEHSAGLSGNQKKLVNTATKTITHNSEGKASFSLDGYFAANVTLSGDYTGTIDLPEKTFTLNTIPRESKLTDSTPNWTAGNDITFSFTRYSSGYNHEIEIYLEDTAGTSTMPDGTPCTHLKGLSIPSTKTSISSAFTLAENTEIFTRIKQRSSVKAWVRLQTFSGANGTNMVGSDQEYYATVTAPTASVFSSTLDRSVYIGDAISLGISRKNSLFTHIVDIVLGSYTKTISDIGTSTTWTPSASEITSLYGQMGASNKKDATLKISTWYNGVKVRSTVTDDSPLTFNIKSGSSNPTFAGGFTYKDINTATTAITGDPLKIVQKVSSVTVELLPANKATAINGATMASYVATLNGVPITKPYSATATVTFDFGQVDASKDLTLSVKAVDNRGNSTTATKTVSILPYAAPVIVSTVKRLNNFEAETTITLSGSISGLVVGGAQKNNLQLIAGQSSPLQYRYRENKSGVSYPSVWTDFIYTTSGTSFTATSAVIPNLDNTKGFIFEIRATDKLQTATITKTVSSGIPIFAMNDNGAMGIGVFPAPTTGPGSLEIGGTLTFPPNKYASAGAALDLKNGDIKGGNCFYFADALGNTEGFFFPNTSATDPLDRAQCDNFRGLDGNLFLNDKKLYQEGNFMVARGSLTMSTVTSNTIVQTVVSFGKTFPGVPTIQLTANSGSANTMKGIMMGSTGASTTGFTLSVAKEITGDVGILWVAMWHA
jgi:hypothetical protein